MLFRVAFGVGQFGLQAVDLALGFGADPAGGALLGLFQFIAQLFDGSRPAVFEAARAVVGLLQLLAQFLGFPYRPFRVAGICGRAGGGLFVDLCKLVGALLFTLHGLLEFPQAHVVGDRLFGDGFPRSFWQGQNRPVSC